MSISATFNSGNYNSFDTFVKKTLPSKVDLIRYTIVPKIDEVLKTMLGANLQVVKDSIDVIQLFDKESIKSLSCTLTYSIEDFDVPDAPTDAIKQDTDALTQALKIEGAELKKININTTGGILAIEYEIPLSNGN